MAGLMVAGRIGAAIAAELGTMRVTEQIDALSTLSTNPHKYLIVLPPHDCGTLMLPILVLISDIIGVFGGFVVSVYGLDSTLRTIFTRRGNIRILGRNIRALEGGCVWLYHRDDGHL